jgi:protein-S-isoprenylcysteine O-methyltransferase Ste14
MPTKLVNSSLLVSTEHLTIILIVVSSIFFVFIGVAIFKMFKLKTEERKLMETNAFTDSEKEYKDYSGGHLYGDQ